MMVEEPSSPQEQYPNRVIEDLLVALSRGLRAPDGPPSRPTRRQEQMHEHSMMSLKTEASRQ